MIKIAVETHKAENIHFICGDVEELNFGEAFDAIVIYNAFPHFPDAERLIARLSNALAPGGILTVAHGMSRERINMHHSGAAKHVSADLMPAEELAEIFKKHLTITDIISNDTMYRSPVRKALPRPANIHSVGAPVTFSPDFHDRILKPVHNSIKDMARDFLTLI